MLCVADSADSAVQLSTSVRLTRVEIWGPPASDLIPVTVETEWAGAEGYAGTSARVTDTSMGSTMPAHVNSRAPAGSMAGMWHASTSTGTLCRIACPVNSIVDVAVQLALADSGTSTQVTGAVAGATAGVLYCRALTSPASTTLLVPVGYISK